MKDRNQRTVAFSITLLSLVAAVVCVPSAHAQPADPGQGPGGPILVVTSASSTYGRYYAEILRTEGFNEFAVSDIGAVTETMLGAYDVAILAPAALTPAQVTMLTNWVNAGGNLIAMRPDPQLGSLLGLAPTGNILSNAYLLVDTSAAPGNGIVGQPMQFHSTAAVYTLNGASSVATLYANATTATSDPAVTLRRVGASGGSAAAFAYDLASSIIYTRQGNPTWATQERDGFTPIRSNDKFYGAATGDPQPDWVDLGTLVSVPQADEQQRLLANLILHMNAGKKPLPRFWYFPRGKKAAVIMTGDDHGNGGTAGRFSQHLAASPPGCNVANWECVRSTSYVYPPMQNLTDSDAASYTAQGFEVGLHVTTDCADFTPSSLEDYYAQQGANFAASYPSVSAPITQRHHCITWSDWITGATTQLRHGMRLDTSYYFWPPGWAQNRPGHFTGSAMPMRFADLDGAIVDVYNAPTQMTDESGQAYPFTIDRLLDAAVGPQAYYGAFTVNAHTDSASNPVSDAVVASALARGIPIVSSVQMLRWLDARNGSSFGGIAWTGNALTFTIAPAGAATGLQAMVPTLSQAGALTGVTGPGGLVAFTIDTIKGVSYAFFPAAAGAYTVSYVPDTTRPTVTSTSPANGATGVGQSATVTATFSEAIDPATINTATFQLRDSANSLVAAAVSYDSGTKIAALRPNSSLAVSTLYSATLTTAVKDLSGNSLAAAQTWSFTTAAGPACPCSAWSSSATPANPSVNDPNPVELGVTFRVDLDGFITGVRFYKGVGNTGTHIGNLWTSSGQLLATATFANETASGWQQVNFTSPVAVTANTIYVASYHTSTGNYAADNGFFAGSGVDNPPVHLPPDGVSGANGVYAYGRGSAFPNSTYQSSNYWVDVVFTTSTGPVPLSVSATTPAAGATGVSSSATVNATFSRALDPATINGSTFILRDPGNAQVPAAYSVSSSTATLTPNAPLTASATYAATVTTGVKDVNGNPLPSSYTWSFTTAAATGGCSAPPNPIVAENCLTGNPASEWDISGAGDATIQGFATDISVNRGGTVNFKIDTTAAAYRLDIYRMGYYGGSGARKVATVNGTGPGNQPACLTNSSTGLIDCGNWTVSASWAVPANATSGIYFAKAVRTDTGGASHIFFIVRDDAGQSDVLFQTSDTTWQAYNDYGGNSLYTGSPGTNPGRAYKVSYNRPFQTRVAEPETWVFNAEYPMVRWLEANGYNVSYFSGVDTERNAILIRNHKVFMSNGHDEYWSAGQRASVQAARDAGVHLAFFSGNTMYWKTRWEPSTDGSGTPYRTLVCYKETHANAVIDPADPPTWTGTWRDPRFSPPADGGRPENELLGALFRVNGPFTGAITVPQEEGRMRLWRNTSVASLATGQQATLAPGSLGAELDVDEDNGFRPAGLMGLSNNPITDSSKILLDYGSTFGAGTTTHKLTLYRAASGALVFDTGTYQWAWGLDSNHDRSSLGSTTDVRMQQATVNLFADLGAQPASLQPGLTAAVGSTDTTAPASTITSPSAGSNLALNSPVTITGTAADTGGGVVGGVEVSVDGGATWRAATGRATWSFAWTPRASGSATIKSRGVDDSGNLETAGTGITVTVGGSGTGCTTNCTIWPGTAVPGKPDAGADNSVELGVRFTADTNGTIRGIRFYKASTNTGTHIGALWSSAGQLLASAPFTGETASGWQEVNFAIPVAITANTVYVASYHTSGGHYSEDQNAFKAGVDNPPLQALQDGVSGFNGVYAYGSTTVFPTQGFKSSNYWVDVVFTVGDAPLLTSIAVTPPNPAIQAGATQQFTATGTYSDSTTQNITSQVTWASSNPAIATINAAGLASGVAAGSTTISAARNSISGSASLTVQPASLGISTTSVPGGTAGVAYSATLTATGGIAPYSWSITSGGLPPDLTLNTTTGAINGTPTASGTFSFTALVTDSASPASTATKSFSIAVGGTTGFLAPNANAPVTALAGDNNGFEATPVNAYASDGQFAVDANSGTNTNTSCTNNGKDKHLFYSYNANLPAGAVISGIEVRLDAKISGGTGTKMCVQLSWDGGASWTAVQSTPSLTTTTATYTLGGAANTWGRTWTANDLSNPSFRLRISDVAGSTARTFYLDGVGIRVTYR